MKYMQNKVIVIDLNSLGGLSPNEFCLLADIILNKGTGWLDMNKPADKNLYNDLLFSLERKLFIKITENTISLRKKALDLRIHTKEIATQKRVSDNFIDKYRALFKGKKIGAMGDRKACIKKFKWFFDEYPEYDEEHILKATKNYVDSCLGKYQFLQQADYFIRKQDPDNIGRSRLASYCEELARDKNKPHEGFIDHFTEKL